jgi:ubiquinone/menaquinone biosynthesis C-methylase UbiE
MPPAHAPHLLNPIRALVLSPDALVRRLLLNPDFTVLELGPGPGYFSPAVARAVPQGKLLLVEVQKEMLDMAKGRIDAQSVVNVEYRQGDALSLPADDASFDVAFLVAVLGEVPDRTRALQELHRFLRPGGLLSLTEMPVFDPDAIPLADLQSKVQAMGFRRCSRHGRLLHCTPGFRNAR